MYNRFLSILSRLIVNSIEIISEGDACSIVASSLSDIVRKHWQLVKKPNFDCNFDNNYSNYIIEKIILCNVLIFHLRIRVDNYINTIGK